MSSGVTGRYEKGSIVNHLLLIILVLWRFLYLLAILLIGSDSFNKSNESGHLKNPNNGVID